MKICSGSRASQQRVAVVLSGIEVSKLLIVEDDKRMGPTLKKGLAEHGYNVSLAATGSEARDALTRMAPSLIVLDLGLPDCDGIDLLQSLRKQGYNQPVLILTARDTTADKVVGLYSGADDYLVKPFAFAELVARVRALLRRASKGGPVLHVGGLSVDLVTRCVEADGNAIALTPREFDLLAYLAQHAGEVVSRDMLQKHVWRETG